ncbi:SIR2 family protein [Herbiconiux sp.]|uniref:SIR2 family NAD-dependent protein deacylase n=1 Tax=Herbiconiux sp. TaxID=1871186 RepID=UPI0025B98D2E|nr:SIR2 family protein [Herbiconiux sp.]
MAAPSSTWVGLIRNGLDFVVDHDSKVARWRTNVDTQLELAIEDNDGDQLLQVAGQLSSKLRGMGEQAFANWLNSVFADIEVADPSWPQSIAELGAPIFTTNYDTVLERFAAGAVDWRSPHGFQRVLNASGEIGHIHGVYTEPDSVVLSEADYTRQKSAEGIQSIERAVSATKSIVYIGCGGTLDDPNFTELLRWHRKTFTTSAMPHYRLCLSSELAALKELHRDSNIEPISYGDNFSDLPAFIKSIAPREDVARSASGVVRDVVTDMRTYLEDQFRQETIIGEGLADLDNKPIDELIVPPVLLPVPHQEFFRSAQEPEEKLDVVNPDEDLDNDGVILLVADENSGLSTAIRWLLLAASRKRHIAPVFLDFRRFPAGHKPLSKLRSGEALERGLIQNRTEPLPAHVLGIDNFHSHNRIAERASDELGGTEGLTIVGCSSVNEADAVDILKRAGCDVRVRYLGKLGTKQVRAMAELASGSKAELLAAAVVATLRSEHLPRTPFTVAMLVSLMARGESLIANASPTAIIDQYVNHLLGRDDANEDSRRALSAADRESILTDLAVKFVSDDHGAVLQSEAIGTMESFFQRFAWEESPRKVLDDLVRRRVLIDDGVRVRFTQSSFLYLFAAKAAAKSPDLLDSILKRPLYYASILTSYAALVRNDRATLEELSKLIAQPPTPGENSAFDARAPRDAPDGLGEHLDEILAATEEAPSEEPPTDLPSSDPLDSSSDVDVLPFPVTDDADLPPLIRFTQSLSLVSVVLRDSEEVDDLALKRQSLETVLRGWGYLSDALHDDESFQELAIRLRAQAEDELGSDEKGFVENLIKLLPSLIMHTGIVSALASRKLLVTAREVADLEATKLDARLAIPSALLIESIGELGWEAQVDALIEPFETTPVVEEFVTIVLLMAYHQAKPGSPLEKRLKDILSRGYLARLKFDNAKERAHVKSSYMQWLERAKGSVRRAGGIAG